MPVQRSSCGRDLKTTVRYKSEGFKDDDMTWTPPNELDQSGSESTASDDPGSGEIKKRLAEDCRRKSDICGSGISRAPLRGSGRQNRRSNGVEAGTTRRKSSRRRSPHDLGSADLATWLRETRPLQARSSVSA
ncbi:hypothetical protein HPB50_005608 [Hyalomma asiaticum]|uniref:Uncharacterized protein n=1 Tax=Hyalomma asiaticum TaxID=266040 RepID=A0ACB7S7M5_HYAAI|nr:hypothetical protein HPB50_005608 [Hyalomma asiaticum]